VSELRPEDRVCPCGGELAEFGEEVSRELERVETTVVHELARKKYACASCKEGVVTAPWRGKVIDKGLLGPGFLSHVIVERFGHHMPYYRLEGKYRSEGLDLSRSVLCASMARCAELLEPIAEQIKGEILASPVVHTDDTPVRLARGPDGKPREARVWAYLNQEGRHWYDFSDSRKRDGPARVFAGFTGYIQADAYQGYDRLYVPGGATEVACWAHARRKFVEAEATEPALAKEAIDRISRCGIGARALWRFWYACGRGLGRHRLGGLASGRPAFPSGRRLLGALSLTLTPLAAPLGSRLLLLGCLGDHSICLLRSFGGGATGGGHCRQTERECKKKSENPAFVGLWHLDWSSLRLSPWTHKEVDQVTR